MSIKIEIPGDYLEFFFVANGECMWKYGRILQFLVANATILVAMYSVGCTVLGSVVILVNLQMQAREPYSPSIFHCGKKQKKTCTTFKFVIDKNFNLIS